MARIIKSGRGAWILGLGVLLAAGFHPVLLVRKGSYRNYNVCPKEYWQKLKQKIKD